MSFPGGGELRAAGQGPQPPGLPVKVAPNTPVAVSVDGDRTALSPAAAQPDVRPASIRGAAAQVVLAAYRNVSAETPALNPEPTTTSPTATTVAPPITVPPTRPSATNRPLPKSPPAPPPPSTPPVAPPAAGANQALVIAGPVLAVPPPGATTLMVDRNRRYRGTVELGSAGGAPHIVNELDVEDYLRGMGEVREPSWPAAALQAQAVAARTYALHAMATGGEICGDDRCQVYLSADAEYPAMDEAVHVTRGRVRRVGADLATTFYSANGGGVSATPEEGFGPGGGNLSYLRADPYKTDDPDPWTVRVPSDEAGRRLRYGARLTGARVSRAGPSGRALEVTLEGDGSPMTLTGQDFAARLQLRSTLFHFGTAGTGIAGASMVPSAPPVDGAEGASTPEVQAARAQIRRPGGGGTTGLTPVIVLVLFGAAGVMFRRWQISGGREITPGSSTRSGCLPQPNDYHVAEPVRRAVTCSSRCHSAVACAPLSSTTMACLPQLPKEDVCVVCRSRWSVPSSPWPWLGPQ